MLDHDNASLIDRLKRAAALWCEANDRSPGALATIVMNHGSFFDRFESPSASTTTATLEKFARFLVDPANWAGGAVPQEVIAFAHVVGVSAAVSAASPGKSDGVSRERAA